MKIEKSHAKYFKAFEHSGIVRREFWAWVQSEEDVTFEEFLARQPSRTTQIRDLLFGHNYAVYETVHPDTGEVLGVDFFHKEFIGPDPMRVSSIRASRIQAELIKSGGVPVVKIVAEGLSMKEAKNFKSNKFKKHFRKGKV